MKLGPLDFKQPSTWRGLLGFAGLIGWTLTRSCAIRSRWRWPPPSAPSNWLAKWKLAAHQEKHWDAPPSHTFDELMLDYLADTQAYKRSAEQDKRCAAWLYPHFTGRELTTLTVGDIYA